MFAATQTFAHGVWIGSSTTSTLDYSAATQTLLQNNIAAGLGGFVVGDFIEYQATLPVGVFGTTAGPNGYVTFYPPGGTEVAGAFIIDAAGTPINSSLPNGISRGWGPRGQNTFFTGVDGWTLNPTACSNAGFTAANCNSGLAYIYGDSGVFYSTHPDTAMYTGGGNTITYANGYVVNPTVTTGWTSSGGAGSVRVHNKWDAVQTNAFGAASVLVNPGFAGADNVRIITTGRASTPFRSGSPVGGNDSGQMLDRNGVVGPWQRVSYGGSCFANDPTIAGVEGPANNIGSVVPQAQIAAANSINVCTSTASGATASDSTPLPSNTKAVRFAIGGVTGGQTVRVKVRLKVTNPANIVANFEGHGSDSMQVGTTTAGNDNPWRYWLGAPVAASTASNRLYVSKQIISVNGEPYNGTSIPPNATVRYRVSYANGSMVTQTNVQVSDVLPTQSVSTNTYTILSGPNITPAVLPTSGTFNFLPIASLAQGAGGSLEYNVATNAALGETVTNQARVASTQVTTLQTASVATLVAAPNPQLTLVKTASVPSVSTPGAVITYTLAVGNGGNTVLSNIAVVDPIGTVICPSSGSSTVNTLVVGATENCTVTYTVPQFVFDTNGGSLEEDGGDGDIDNTASASTTYSGTPLSANSSAAVLVTIVTSMSLDKIANTAGPVNVNDNIGYSYRVTNTGNVTIYNITIADVHSGVGAAPIPGSEAIFTDVAPLGNSTDAGINNSWDSLAPGDTIEFLAAYSVVQADIDNQ